MATIWYQARADDTGVTVDRSDLPVRARFQELAGDDLFEGEDDAVFASDAY